MPLTPTWAKSSHSDPNGGNCVEARDAGAGAVQVRDSKDSSGPKLSFSSGCWQQFTAAVRTPGQDAKPRQ